MTMFSAAELEDMRATAELSMEETALVKRAANTTDSQGGYTTSWSTQETTTGRLAPGGGASEQLFAEELQSRTAWTIWLPQGTDVTARDRIAIGTRTFEVLGIVAPHTYETARGAVCVEVV